MGSGGEADPSDLIDRFAHSLDETTVAWPLAEHALELVVSLTGARRAAAFNTDGGGLRRLGSYAVDGADLAAMQARCESCRGLLETGQAGYVAQPSGSGAGGFAVVPGFRDEWIGLALVSRRLVVLLCVDSDSPHYDAGHTIELMVKCAHMMAGWSLMDTAAPPAPRSD